MTLTAPTVPGDPSDRSARPVDRNVTVLRRAGLLAIKTVHSAIFLGVASSILVILADGLRGRPSRRTAAAGVVTATECLVFAANGFRCPLTGVAESLGADDGTVSDIFLPRRFAARLPVISSTVLVVAVLLNLRALAAARPLTGEVPRA